MSIKETLLKDRSKATCERIMEFIGDDPQKCKEWTDCLLVDDFELNQKAAWVLHFITDVNPTLVDSFQNSFLEKIKHGNHHDAVLRAILRHWGDYGFPEAIEGEVYDLSLRYLQNNSSIGIKAHAMFAAYRVVERYKELAPELKIVLEEAILKYGEESPAIRSRGNKMLKKLDKVLLRP